MVGELVNVMGSRDGGGNDVEWCYLMNQTLRLKLGPDINFVNSLANEQCLYNGELHNVRRSFGGASEEK